MNKGKEVAAKLRKGKSGGIPWMVIQDKKGKELITSDGPDGNVGCPVQPKERKWFTHLIQKTKKRMTDKDLSQIEQSLDAFAKKLGR